MAPDIHASTPNPALFLFLVFGFIPGVYGDSYNLTGLVASSIASIFFLIIVVAVVTMGVIWHRWYPRYQLAHNKVKIPCATRLAKLYGSQVEIIEPDNRSIHMTSYPPSMRSTKVMVPTTTTYQKADTWINEQGRYGGEPPQKESVMNFDEEEGDVIITEVEPEREFPKSRLTTTVQVDAGRNNATDDEITRLTNRQSELVTSQGLDGVFNFDDDDDIVANSVVVNEGTVLY